MKQKLILGIVLICTLFGFAQEETLTKTEEAEMIEALAMYTAVIDMDIDKSIYTNSTGNTHMTVDQKAGIIGMYMPKDFESMKVELEKSADKDGAETIKKEELKVNGETILYLKQKMTRGTEEYTMIMYFKKNDKKSCVAVTSFFEFGKEDQYEKLIEKAAFSAKIQSKK